jgi:hypothetical protein
MIKVLNETDKRKWQMSSKSSLTWQRLNSRDKQDIWNFRQRHETLYLLVKTDQYGKVKLKAANYLATYHIIL